MGTHCRITDGETSAYVHYDGDPGHMLPELRAILEDRGLDGVDILLAHDWSYINSDQKSDRNIVPTTGVPGIGLCYSDRPKMSDDRVRLNAGSFVYLLDRSTLTVRYI